ncbi:hypothetical protein [Longimicrobium terrae]|uniref:Lipoprotein n=1 Tax=Longimicrobium terrae TaxID=1639882 RepID=A0A841H609_9BACT|nr:hypothetical protein [Longimicrobium terrae]MBB4639388.1 hypothetical protein [Longimicrobium terrae]MBB6073695.1 hypothetical protein [Longimicrobium terrae]NNC30640.1 hypothetical protein [Longimicrobium terrae]
MRMRCAGVMAAALLLGGCPASPPAAAPVPVAAPARGERPGHYQGVVIQVSGGGAADTARVSFAANWRRVADGADSVWAFTAQPAGGGWSAYGRRQGDSLVWALTRRAGDAGTVREFAGPVAANGTVRGCARPPRGGRWTGGRGGEYGAFALAPVGEPFPSVAQVPLAACAAAAGR